MHTQHQKIILTVWSNPTKQKLLHAIRPCNESVTWTFSRCNKRVTLLTKELNINKKKNKIPKTAY